MLWSYDCAKTTICSFKNNDRVTDIFLKILNVSKTAILQSIFERIVVGLRACDTAHSLRQFKELYPIQNTKE